MTALNKQALTDEAISQAFTGTNFGRDDLKNILAETVIDAAAGWRCGHTATTICTQLGLLTPKGSASVLGFRFISEHVQRETKRLKDELEAAERRIAELQSKSMRPVAWMRSDDITTFGPIFTKNENYAVEQWGNNAVALYASPVNFKLACFTDERNLKYINERGRETSLIWSERNSENGDVQLFRAAGIGVKGE